MHGVKRAKHSPEALLARQQKERAKIQEFLALSEDVLRRKKDKDYSEDAFKLTTKLLHINPEFYTVWNYRRNILTAGFFADSQPEKVNKLLADELVMTMASLKTHPKVYWIWNHRRWCLEHVPDGPGEKGSDTEFEWRKSAWDHELFVIEKMLDADARNFIAWAYRRYVLANMPVPRPEISELAYTSRKIEANFSNFSAWHQRSKVLPKLWEFGTIDKGKSREEEFDLVRNAMYTDPNDQSVWVYHRWLVGTYAEKDLLEREIIAIEELLEEQPDSKWCMESIVHYTRMLLKDYPSEVDVDQLTEKSTRLLEELERIDPDRKRRYQYLASTLG